MCYMFGVMTELREYLRKRALEIQGEMPPLVKVRQKQRRNSLKPRQK